RTPRSTPLPYTTLSDLDDGRRSHHAQPRLDLKRASGSPVPAVAGCGRGASAPRTAPGDQSVAGVRRPGPASTDGTDTARADGVGAAGVGEAEGGIGATAIRTVLRPARLAS